MQTSLLDLRTVVTEGGEIIETIDGKWVATPTFRSYGPVTFNDEHKAIQYINTCAEFERREKAR